MMDGRVKTLHPKVHGGLLGRDRHRRRGACASTASRRSTSSSSTSIRSRETVAKPGCTLRGGDREHRHRRAGDDARGREEPRARRASSSTPPTTRASLAELRARRHVGDATRRRLAAKAFAPHRAVRRRWSPSWLRRAAGRRRRFRMRSLPAFRKQQDLRYGENPHQRAAFYATRSPRAHRVATARQLQGKELSYNNIADADAALECVRQFDDAGLRDRQARQSLRRRRGRRPARRLPARLSPPTRPRRSAASSPSTARSTPRRPRRSSSASSSRWSIAPASTPARSRCSPARRTSACWDRRARRRAGPRARPQARRRRPARADAGRRHVDAGELKVVTRARRRRASSRTCCSPGASCKFVKSNAIVFAKDGATVGIGAGQMSRVDLDADRRDEGGRRGPRRSRAASMASDAFFPFRDGLDAAAEPASAP